MGDCYVCSIGCELAVALPTYKVKLSVRSFFARHNFSNEFTCFDLGNDEQVPDSISLLADKERRLSIEVESAEDFIAGEFGD